MKNKLFAMLVLLMTAVTGAWAQEQSETIATTAKIVEGTHFTIDNHGKIANESGMNADGGITVTAKSGETITKVVITCTFMAYVVNDGNTSVSSGTKEFTGDGETITVITVTGVNASTFTFTCSNTGPYFRQFVVYFTPTDVTGLTLSQTEAAMTVGGDALTLTATVAPANATYKTVTWTTSNASVATVANGVVTAVGEGTATITATATNGTAATSDDKTATCTVTVAEPIETVNADSTVVTIEEMPAYDVTVDYELVRDMSVQMTATMGDGTDGVRYRVKKAQQGEGYEPADLNMMQVLALVAVNDGIEQKDLTLDQDYFCRIYKLDEQTLQPTGDGVKLNDFDFAPGLYALKAFPKDDTDYVGETALSNTFKLFVGYEVEVGAESFATFYKDEKLTVEESSTTGELYTISSVSADEAVLSAQIGVAPANTPLLVYNSGSEKKTILLIPTEDEADSGVTYANEFKGTLVASTIAASTENQTNYALNGKQFVWVKNALSIGANKCWLEVVNSNARAISIMFNDEETTGISTAVTTVPADGDWYDLNGRKVTAPTRKGVYIHNGKKAVVK